MRTIALVAPNVSETMGGEAIKAFQYAKHLISIGRDVKIFCHARCRDDAIAAFGRERVEIIENDWSQILAWRSVVFRGHVHRYFQKDVARRISETFEKKDVVIHYIAPVSPVVRRYPPAGYDFVVGPMTGNIYYPDGFERRMTVKERLRAAGHDYAQRLGAAFSKEKAAAAALLVSGHDRTRASLIKGGARPEQIVDVVDSGVNESLMSTPRLRQNGVNYHFVSIGRLIPYKGYDLAIRAIAAADPMAELDIFGDGYLLEDLKALARELGVAGRVHFRGRLDNNAIAEVYSKYRAFIFPTLAEANGIVMQEAMMIGLPTITLRWGGPSLLANDAAAAFIDPTNDAQVVRELAEWMDRLACDPGKAEEMSVAARDIAEQRFDWRKVTASWMAAYPE